MRLEGPKVAAKWRIFTEAERQCPESQKFVSLCEQAETMGLVCGF